MCNREKPAEEEGRREEGATSSSHVGSLPPPLTMPPMTPGAFSFQGRPESRPGKIQPGQMRWHDDGGDCRLRPLCHGSLRRASGAQLLLGWQGLPRKSNQLIKLLTSSNEEVRGTTMQLKLIQIITFFEAERRKHELW